MDNRGMVQMYYVSGGVPVGLDGIPTKPPQSTGSSIALGEAFTYKPLSKSTSQGHNQVNGTPMHRSDSLESLLSLNVLASELLNDHDDLQGVDNFPSSPPSRQSPYGSEAYSGTPASSHHRYHSYSTVSSRAPATPPTNDHHTAFQYTDNSPSQTTLESLTIDKNDTVKDHHDIPSDRNTFGSVRPRNLAQELGAKSLNTQDGPVTSRALRPSDAKAPRIESMVIQGALSPEPLNAELGAEEGSDALRTPLAEISNPLAASESANTLRPESLTQEGAARSWETADYQPVHSGEKADGKPNGFGAVEDNLDMSHETPRDGSADRKGKGKAIDQDAPTADGGIQAEEERTSVDSSGMPPSSQVNYMSASASHGGNACNSNIPASSSSKKISEWLKEQYETKQKTGGFAPGSPPQSPPTRQRNPNGGSGQPNGVETSHHTVQQGQAPYSLPSSDSQHSRLNGDAQAERAQLLHSIISQDFAGPRITTSASSQAPSKDLLWHPTEYVGPPRRRSISGTSVLGLGRKTKDARPSQTRHVRQASADALTTLGSSARKQEADEMGRRRIFAASADDLLMRARPIPDQHVDMNGGKTSGSTRQSNRSRLFSIKRKAPPLAPATSQFAGPAGSPGQDGPFRHMINTSSLPQQPKTTRPSLGHKKSLSGSIQGMLSSFGASSKARRQRNTSVTEPSMPLDTETRPADFKPSAFTNGTNGHHAAQSSAASPADGRHSPFKMWKYPPTKQSHSHDGQSTKSNGTLNTVRITQTQVATLSSPVSLKNADSRSESPFFKNAHRLNEGSRALSNADTIEEAELEDDAASYSIDGHQEDDNEEDKRLKGLASQQVARDSDYRARVVEKFKDGERSASSLGFYERLQNGH